MFQAIEGNVSVYKKIVKQIQNKILSGELKKGDRLPPERQMAEMLQVGRPALKQALSALEMIGVIQSRQGDGNYITADTMSIFNPLAMQYYLNDNNSDDLLEFRYMIEVNMASLAAVKITETQLSELDALMEDMRVNIIEPTPLEIRQDFNNRFHMKIIEIGGNKLIQLIYAGIMDMIADQIKQTDGTYFYESHLKIVQAIHEGDSNKAGQCMAEHFQKKFPNYQYYRDVWNL